MRDSGERETKRDRQIEAYGQKGRETEGKIERTREIRYSKMEKGRERNCTI